MAYLKKLRDLVRLGRFVLHTASQSRSEPHMFAVRAIPQVYHLWHKSGQKRT